MEKTHQLFMAQPGGAVTSTVRGDTVLRIHVENLTVDEALRVQTAVLAALEAEFMPQMGAAER